MTERYCPGRAFPPYAFRPGVDPHPTRDPRGHSYGSETADDDDATALRWGVDLYNHGYFWEAHEAWEDSWRSAERGSPRAELLQGLIQCAAACLKLRIGARDGARRLAQRGLDHLARAGGKRGAQMELDAGRFARGFQRWIASDPEEVESRPRLQLATSDRR